MSTNKEQSKEHPAMNKPPIVSQQEWEAARQQLLVKEKALTRARDERACRLEGWSVWRLPSSPKSPCLPRTCG
jgi:hypothetical protein